MVKHWLLIFEYENRVIQFQGMPATQGHFFKPIIEDIEWNQRANSTYLTTIRTSPKKVMEHAMANELTLTKYDTFKNNCQDWILELLEMIVPDLPSLNKYKEATVSSKYKQFLKNLHQERDDSKIKSEL